MSVFSDAAEHYARDLGFAVFPLLPNSKRPAVANGVKDATTDADVIAGGAVLLGGVMDALSLREVAFSDEDNLEGYLRYRGLIC